MLCLPCAHLIHQELLNTTMVIDFPVQSGATEQDLSCPDLVLDARFTTQLNHRESQAPCCSAEPTGNAPLCWDQNCS